MLLRSFSCFIAVFAWYFFSAMRRDAILFYILFPSFAQALPSSASLASSLSCLPSYLPSQKMARLPRLHESRISFQHWLAWCLRVYRLLFFFFMFFFFFFSFFSAFADFLFWLNIRLLLIFLDGYASLFHFDTFTRCPFHFATLWRHGWL